MTYTEFQSLKKWCKLIGINDGEHLSDFINKYELHTIPQILNTLNGCAVYELHI